MTESPDARFLRAVVPHGRTAAKAVARRGASVRALLVLLGAVAALVFACGQALAAPAHAHQAGGAVTDSAVRVRAPAAPAPSPPSTGDPTPGATPTPGEPTTPAPGAGGNPECDSLPPGMKERCVAGNGTGALNFAADPLGAIAQATAEAAVWFITKLAVAINATTSVDFTNPGFIKQYAVVFAASAFLTLIVWMVAVTKRAVRGVPLGTALGEAVGYLWLAVMASAFTPAVLHLSVSVVDSITAAIASGTKQDTDKFLDGFSQGLDPQSLGGGPVTLIFVSMFAILAAMILWIELLVRAALLYVGAILGTVVYAGIVNRDLWGHVRRWAGMMIAILLAKPIIVIVLGLAMAASSGAEGDDKLAGVLTGLAIMFLAIFASVMVYRFVPALGDDVASLRAGRMEMAASTKSALTGGTASYVKAGMGVHAGRATTGGTATATASTGTPSSGSGSPASGVASGVSAHGRDAPSGGGGPALQSPRWLEGNAGPPASSAPTIPHTADPPAPRTPTTRRPD
ncbi:hypothetical protein LO772_26375 [Yinghuangia sp. ASG 101]|uniref:hypothetical protein n=1 Tax=Yinghuangia sp. ASG 101 TaxID=2896848 RepID=UPI001E2D556B|nr:hypothetical protein [Yinghuangia sp. ASG 101]UGQ10361.1 hypothetical protein LO772_26375 [Yinghuangia sp. ASG 101]